MKNIWKHIWIFSICWYLISILSYWIFLYFQEFNFSYLKLLLIILIWIYLIIIIWNYLYSKIKTLNNIMLLYIPHILILSSFSFEIIFSSWWKDWYIIFLLYFLFHFYCLFQILFLTIIYFLKHNKLNNKKEYLFNLILSSFLWIITFFNFFWFFTIVSFLN